jgi:NAD(P)-dependent dehydrogenase (short-subunit alcohol dehydrogenase family)
MKTNPFGPKGWTPERIGSLAGKTYLITGANSGTGFEASRTLLSKGARVVMLNRSPEKSNAAIARLQKDLGQGADVSFIRIDLGDLASVRKAAAETLEKAPQIDALICNGAIAQVPVQKLTVDGFESQLGVNHYGHFLLCALLLERIEQSKGRIVVVGSTGYRMGLKRIKFEDLNFDKNYTAWNAYAQSKLAQVMFAYELQRRVRAAGKNVEVHACHPGASRTSLIDNSGSTANKIVWGILKWIMAQPAQKGAWPEVMCATEEGLKPETLYGPTKRGETVGAVGECRLDPCALDRDAAARLWEISEQETGLGRPLQVADSRHASRRGTKSPRASAMC